MSVYVVCVAASVVTLHECGPVHVTVHVIACPSVCAGVCL